MTAIVYDAAVLIAADRDNRRVWAEHRALLEDGLVPLVPAAVVARVSRSARQVQLRGFLRGCVVVSLDERAAHAAGRLLAAARSADVVDASVVAVAMVDQAEIVTGGPEDISALVRASGVRLKVRTL